MGEFDLILRPDQLHHDEASAIARALGGTGVASRAGWYRCPCPAHRGTRPSLSVKDNGPGRLVAKCWSRRCLPIAVLRAIDHQLGTSFVHAEAAAAFADAPEK